MRLMLVNKLYAKFMPRFKFEVLEIDLEAHKVLGFQSNECIATWISFDELSENQIKKLKKAYKTNGKYFRY